NAQISNLRGDALRTVFDPAVLGRLSSRHEIDADPKDQLGVYDVLGAVRSSIWKEIEGATPASISTSRRTLQRMHLDVLTKVWGDPNQGDVRDAALSDLTKIRVEAKRSL